MPQIGSFVAWIEVENSQLQEHEIKYSADGKRVTCWIASETGKAFSICVKDSIRAHASGTFLSLDGTKVSGKILYPMSSHPGESRSTCAQPGLSVSDSSYKPFVFSNCELVDDDSFNPSFIRPEIGEIEVVVNKIALRGRTKSRRLQELRPLQLNEKDKKGVVHGTQLGEVILKHPKKARRTKRLKHIATFIFKYRPLSILQANGMVPLSRSTSRACAMNYYDVIDLTVKDEDDVSRQKRTRLSVKGKVKREAILDGETIDLTQES